MGVLLAHLVFSIEKNIFFINFYQIIISRNNVLFLVINFLRWVSYLIYFLGWVSYLISLHKLHLWFLSIDHMMCVYRGLSLYFIRKGLMLYINQVNLFFIIFISVILTACGGGGGGDTTPTNNAPAASNVTITDINGGNVLVGDTLTGSYSYTDEERDIEGTSNYRWLRDGVTITGETSLNYSLLSADNGLNITFEVTPIAATGTVSGSAVTSNAILITTPPANTPLTAINDTGITGCGDFAVTYTDGAYDTTGSGIHNNNLDCSIQATVPTQLTDGYEVAATGGDIIRAGQDALYGRDVTHNDDTDGHAGFSYTQLDSNGTPLATKSTDYSITPWSCVRDNVTGLIWEVKQPGDSGAQLRNTIFKYTWYNSTGINDAGEHGVGDTGVGTTTGLETNNAIIIGFDQCLDSARCDTEKFVADVNSGSGICGSTDWRLPTKLELMSIVDNSIFLPSIDTKYFPNFIGTNYWTSSPISSIDSILFAWSVDFQEGSVVGASKANGWSIRLVRKP